MILAVITVNHPQTQELLRIMQLKYTPGLLPGEPNITYNVVHVETYS